MYGWCSVLGKEIVTSRFIHELISCRKWASQPLSWWKPFLSATQFNEIQGQVKKPNDWLPVPKEIIVDLLYKVTIIYLFVI
jgi:hypothetical protein